MGYFNVSLLHLMIPFFFHCAGMVIAWPALADTVVHALCSTDKCNEAIFLSGLQHAISSFAVMFTTPWLGAVSDRIGRKPLIVTCFVFTAIPYYVLAYSETKTAVYVYWVVKGIASVFGEGLSTTLVLAYVADVIPAKERSSSFGLVMSCMSVGLIAGIVVSWILPEAIIFQVASLVCTVPVFYAFFFLPETLPEFVMLPRREEEANMEEGKSVEERNEGPVLIRRSTLIDSIHLIRNSGMLKLLAVVAFLASFGEHGLLNSLMFYLKGRLHFEKNQFAQLYLVVGTASLLSQVVLLPLFVRFFKNHATLTVGVFFAIIHSVLYAFASSDKLAYTGAAIASFTFFIVPTSSAILSEQGSVDDQGKLQGLLAGVRSLASVLAPLVINPLTALFFSKEAPFHCPGFAFLVCAAVEALAFVLCLFLSSEQNHTKLSSTDRTDEDAIPTKADPPTRIDTLQLSTIQCQCKT